MPHNPFQPDMRPFLTYVEQELQYLEAFDVCCNYNLLKAAGALVILQEYLRELCSD